MFVIPSKYVVNVSPIFECIESIINFHPNEKILIVDSYSENDSYLEEMKKYDNVIISKYKNKHYECGALYYAIKEFPNEHFYALIQDSIILKHSWEEFLYDDITYNLMYFNERTFMKKELDYTEEVIKNTEYNKHENNGHVGIYGMLMVYKQEIIQKFIKKNLLKSSLPNDKFGSQMTERIIGICLSQEGYIAQNHTIEGDFLSKHRKVGDGLKYFKKIYGGRQ